MFSKSTEVPLDNFFFFFELIPKLELFDFIVL